jgi:hypothetical protein
MPTTACCSLTQSGRTALMWAANGGHLSIVKCLLSEGASTDIVDKVGTCRRRNDDIKFAGASILPASSQLRKTKHWGSWDSER